MHACVKQVYDFVLAEIVMGINVLKTFTKIKPSLLNNNIANC